MCRKRSKSLVWWRYRSTGYLLGEDKSKSKEGREETENNDIYTLPQRWSGLDWIGSVR
jgi:hypothetical protein